MKPLDGGVKSKKSDNRCGKTGDGGANPLPPPGVKTYFPVVQQNKTGRRTKLAQE
jgi:hypothetical protein